MNRDFNPYLKCNIQKLVISRAAELFFLGELSNWLQLEDVKSAVPTSEVYVPLHKRKVLRKELID